MKAARSASVDMQACWQLCLEVWGQHWWAQIRALLGLASAHTIWLKQGLEDWEIKGGWRSRNSSGLADVQAMKPKLGLGIEDCCKCSFEEKHNLRMLCVLLFTVVIYKWYNFRTDW